MEEALSVSNIGNDAGQPIAIAAEVAACLPAFPVLRAQLRQTVTQAEQAIAAVCGSFQSMVTRAKDSVACTTESLAKTLTTDGRQSNSGSLIAVTHKILERAEAASSMTLQTVEKMAQVEEGMRHITGSLCEVNAIARTLGLVALNATIEAASAGEHGRTFAVVAAETTKLADSAGQISKSIQKIVEQLRKNVDDTSRELNRMSIALNADSEASRTEVDGAVGAMIATEAELRQSVERSARNSESLAEDIAGAMIAMQFQDSMSQQVMHVVDTLQEMEAGLSEQLRGGQGGDRPAGRHERHDRAADLLARYTMQSERDIHSAQVGTRQRELTALGDNAELF